LLNYTIPEEIDNLDTVGEEIIKVDTSLYYQNT